MTEPKKTRPETELTLLAVRAMRAEREIQRLIRSNAHPETICEAIDWLISLQRQRQRIIHHRGAGRGRRA